jgi:hypothetical protein
MHGMHGAKLPHTSTPSCMCAGVGVVLAVLVAYRACMVVSHDVEAHGMLWLLVCACTLHGKQAAGSCQVLDTCQATYCRASWVSC